MTQITILCSDTSSHALGRSWLIAEILKTSFEVEIVGPKFGKSRWYPLYDYDLIKDVRIPMPSGFPAFLPELMRAATGEIMYASKLRTTSFGLALLKRRRHGTPIALDIDDWEAAYTLDMRKLKRIYSIPLQFGHPDGFPYVSALELLARKADFVTVASTNLKARFGGEVLYHVRDTDALDPDRYNNDKCRANIGLESSFNVMFLGSPARHKGLADLAEAIVSTGLRDVILAVVGPRNEIVREVQRKHPQLLKSIPERPIGEVGQLLAAADLVCLPQRPSRYGSFQVPAKVFDAMSMAKPIIATAVSDLSRILDGSALVVPPLDPKALRSAVLNLYHDRSLGKRLGRAARERCIREFSIDRARHLLVPPMTALIETGGRAS